MHPEELGKRFEQLAQVNEDLQRSVYAAAHDLQEPLRAIGIYTQLLQERTQGKLDEESVHLVDLVLSGVDRMKRLIQDMLEFARISHEVEEAKVQVDTYAVAEDALQDLQPAIDESGAKIEIDPLPAVYANKEEVLRLFQNLIGNAIKYRGDDPPEIRISAVLKDCKWIFSVTDNGIGIDPRYHQRIFEMFERLDRGPRYDGSGLGLATCKKIVQRHNGRIWVQSEPGHGSTFYFTLPAYQTAAAGVHWSSTSREP